MCNLIPDFFYVEKASVRAPRALGELKSQKALLEPEASALSQAPKKALYRVFYIRWDTFELGHPVS